MTEPTPPADPKAEKYTEEYVVGLRQEAAGLRQEVAGHRLKATETQQKLDAALGERDEWKARHETADAARVTAEGAALEAKMGADARVLNVELKAAAVAAGLIDADDLRLVDSAALKLNDKGEVEGVAELIETFKTGKPHLFKADAAPGAPPHSNSNPLTPPAPKAPAAKKASEMTPEEYSAERARIARGGLLTA